MAHPHIPVSFNELLLCHWEHLACWLVSHTFQSIDIYVAGIPQGIGKQRDFLKPSTFNGPTQTPVKRDTSSQKHS